VKRPSFRSRLLLPILLVQAMVLGALAYNSGRLIDHAIKSQIEHRIEDVSRLLSAALAVPMLERDYAAIKDEVQNISKDKDLAYLRVQDRSGFVVAQFDRPDDGAPRFDGRSPITLGRANYGEIAFGLSGLAIESARRQVYIQSVGLALAAFMASGFLLLLTGLWVSRQFRTLADASTRVADGDYSTQIPLQGEPELDRVASAFNRMSESVRSQVRQLQESEARFHAIADYTHDLEFWLSSEGRLLWINPSVERMLGYTVAECMQMPDFPLNIVHADDQAAAEPQLREALKGTLSSGYVFRACRKDGSVFWASASWLPIYDQQANSIGLRASIHNVDALKSTEASLRQAVASLKLAESMQLHYLDESEQERARLVSLLSAMNLGILFVGQDGRVIYHNPAFNRMWAIDESNPLVGLPVEDVLLKSSSMLARPDHFSKHLLSVLETREISDSFEIQLADGRVFTELDFPVRDRAARFIGHLWIYEDVTRERQTAEQLIYLAERDPLTGLFNRHRFQTELERVVSEAERREERCAVIFFDLDEFKEINDSFGHRAGDALLIRVAGEVGTLVRRNEIFARLGGDEFAILLPNVRTNEAEALAERVVRAVAQIPFRFEGRNLRLTTSLGVACLPDHAADADELVAKADIAMYQAKQVGKNTWRVFRADSEATLVTMERLTWNDRISHALEHGLFRLHFQGIYHVAGMKLAHSEALVRMADERNPGQLIMPTHFIPVAEKTGRVVEIDRWVIAEAVRTLARAPETPGIAVNISARSLSEPTLSQFIAETLHQHKVSPYRLNIELTETAAVADLHDAQRLIEALRLIGCGVCLDDFGTGFSSFAYLKHLRADTLKIDGLFIRDLHLDTDNQVFVRAMVNVARGLGKTVVAEYVENEKTLNMLKEFGVNLVQGYFLHMPGESLPGNNLPPR
jgi:diguanylate cyclase (GGDEF)-like protein/PAS domain S-box-containing protein